MLDFYRALEVSNEICDGVTTKGEGIVARCPVCGDSSKSKRIKRLHIDWYSRYDTWVVTCFNGGCPFRSGDIYSLYSAVKGCTYGEAKKYINQEVYEPSTIKKRLKTKIRPIEVKEKTQQDFDIDFETECLTIHSIPDGVIQTRLQVALKKFISDRCLFSQQDHIYVAHSGKYKCRIIIPIRVGGEIVYFQGRAILDSMEHKYLNPEVDKDTIILNSDNFDKDKMIVLTEGTIDAWMVDYNQGTPFLGSFVNDGFLDELYKHTDKGIIIAWDNPFIDNAGKDELMKFINGSRYSKKIKYFLMPHKDCKDLNDLKIKHPEVNDIYEFVVKNSFSYYNTIIKLRIS